MNNLYSSYKGKRVFITGITGFKGSWLALILKQLGAEVYGLGIEQKNSDSIFYKAEINNIANLEFGNMEKSISAYIKYKIYMDTLNYDEIYTLINNRMLNIELLYAYMLYPNFYFNDVIQIIDNCKKEK